MSETLLKTEEYYQALDRVAIGEFIKRGIQLRGVVHVGANDGYEVQWYQRLGLDIMCFEPGPKAYVRFKERYPNVKCYNFALGNINCRTQLSITPDDGGSTCLVELVDSAIDVVDIDMVRWSTWALLQPPIGDTYNACVIDVQGMELDVLRGMDECLDVFDCFVIECSSRPVYKGEASAEEVIRFMEKRGYSALNVAAEHDDVLFAKTGLLHVQPVPLSQSVPRGTKLNLGSGQRPFDTRHGWINIDTQERFKPDFIGDIRNLSMFDDNSMEMIVLHQVLEHFGCGEASGCIRESYRTLKPGGSLIITIPDIRALAEHWLAHQIDDYIYTVNLMGAYMGDETDRHKWHLTQGGLKAFLLECAPWPTIVPFNWRAISGASIAKAFWILGMEATK